MGDKKEKKVTYRTKLWEGEQKKEIGKDMWTAGRERLKNGWFHPRGKNGRRNFSGADGQGRATLGLSCMKNY